MSKIAWTELGGVKNGYFRRNIFIDNSRIGEANFGKFITECGGSDVYYSIFTYEQPNSCEGNLFGPAYFDFDAEVVSDDDFWQLKVDTLLAIKWLNEFLCVPEQSMQLFFSGSKGFHLLLDPILFDIRPCPDLNEQYRSLADRLAKALPYKTLDRRIYDKRRLFRIPNSINAKTGLYKIPMTITELRTWNWRDISEMAQQQRQYPWGKFYGNPGAMRRWQEFLEYRSYKQDGPAKVEKFMLPEGKKKDLLPCVAAALEVGVTKGSRNNTAVALASSLCQAGYTRDEAVETLISWNEQNDPPVSDREIYATCRSAFIMADSGRGYGCRYFKDAGLCTEQEDCPALGKEQLHAK